MNSVELSNEAANDLDAIFDYTVDRHGSRQAVVYTENIRSSATVAASFPSFDKSYVTKKGREFKRYRSGKHFLFYDRDESGIYVVRILHAMMDFDRHLD